MKTNNYTRGFWEYDCLTQKITITILDNYKDGEPYDDYRDTLALEVEYFADGEFQMTDIDTVQYVPICQ
jgi:hypothetical protein